MSNKEDAEKFHSDCASYKETPEFLEACKIIEEACSCEKFSRSQQKVARKAFDRLNEIEKVIVWGRLTNIKTNFHLAVNLHSVVCDDIIEIMSKVG